MAQSVKQLTLDQHRAYLGFSLSLSLKINTHLKNKFKKLKKKVETGERSLKRTAGDWLLVLWQSERRTQGGTGGGQD